ILDHLPLPESARDVVDDLRINLLPPETGTLVGSQRLSKPSRVQVRLVLVAGARDHYGAGHRLDGFEHLDRARGSGNQPSRPVSARFPHAELEVVPALLRMLPLGELVEPGRIA